MWSVIPDYAIISKSRNASRKWTVTYCFAKTFYEALAVKIASLSIRKKAMHYNEISCSMTKCYMINFSTGLCILSIFTVRILSIFTLKFQTILTSRLSMYNLSLCSEQLKSNEGMSPFNRRIIYDPFAKNEMFFFNLMLKRISQSS